ncbi:helix-turn-helix domain-containing protein [Mucilaginibacter sp.]
MQKEVNTPYIINSISELHRMLGLPKPQHPLISVIDLNTVSKDLGDEWHSFSYNFYSICAKKDFNGKLKYGQHYYDFDEGILTLMAPGQILSVENYADPSFHGWWLVVHPDFVQGYTLAKNIRQYGYFSYAVNEALHMSEAEENVIVNLLQQIQQEYTQGTDNYSQDVLVSYVELLLNYCNRFYNRQFITRKQANHDLLSNVETLLAGYFENGKQQEGLPTVQHLADQLHVTPNYLSDMLRLLTGRNAQQHIHEALIEKAKELITTTSLSVSEIAYRLGFEYPQSFNKLFKNKTSRSPLEFRQSFN